MADVESILRAQKEKYKSVEVKKDIGIHLDVGNLMVSDVNLIDNDIFKVAWRMAWFACNVTPGSWQGKVKAK
jgi:hypothetical protein